MECIPNNFTTPMNTLGMGGVNPETDPYIPCKKTKRMRSIKEYIKYRKYRKKSKKY